MVNNSSDTTFKLTLKFRSTVEWFDEKKMQFKENDTYQIIDINTGIMRSGINVLLASAATL